MPKLLSTRRAALAALAACAIVPAAHADAPLASIAVAPATAGAAAGFDGVVEAVRQSVLAAQVAGAVVELNVRAGDRVKAGQVLLRLDARAAQQQAGAAAAQVQAARATQEAATRDYQRQQQLYAQRFISEAALQQAEAQYKAATAGASAQLASADAARTQSGFYVVTAPYAGVVADVAVVMGDMAMPGRPLLTVYDPAALRVTAAVPQTVAAKLVPATALRLELPGAPEAVPRWELLPAVDPATHTQALRVPLPAGTAAAPGQFARVWLPQGGAARVQVPSQAVVQRAELAAVYVMDGQGRPLLRQVRLGRASGGQVEVLAGLAAGERVALDPQAAARVR